MTRTLTLISALAILAGACSDGSGNGALTAQQLEGFWVFSSITVVEGGEDMTLVRDGEPGAVRGDALVVATSATEGRMFVRLFMTMDDFPVALAVVDEVEIRLTGSTFTVMEGDDETSFHATLTGTTLRLDSTDTVASDAPKQLVLTRASAWGEVTQGDWEVVELTMGGETQTAGACVETDEGEGVIGGMALSFDPHLVVRVTETDTYFEDPECQTLSHVDERESIALAEEEGSTLRLWTWSSDHDGEGYIELTLQSSAGETLTLERVRCAPVPACEAYMPTRIVLGRP